jgi:cytoskeletal protein RodZ
MSQSLGEKLRQAREERGISVSEVAEQTRISPLYIKAIENDDYKPLPGGIFNKGFVRSYARYVGFDEEEALRDYAELIGATGIQPEADQTVHRSEVWTDDRSVRSMAPTIIFAAIILVMMAGGLLLLVRYISNSGEPAAVARNSNTGNNSQVNANSTNGETPEAPAATVADLSVGLKALSEPVWIAYTVDGNRTEKTLDAGQAVTLDAKDTVKLSYAKVKAASLEVSINGRKLSIPTTSTKGSFDIDINRSNAQQLIASGIADTAPAATPKPAQTTATPRPSPRPTILSTPNPARPANTAAPRRTP